MEHVDLEPKLVKELETTVTPWCTNRLGAVDGKEIQPGGAAMLSVSDGRMSVVGKALVLDGDIELILTSVQGHFRKIWNADEDWGATRNLHWRHRHQSPGEKAPKLVIQQECWVPPRSMKVVATR
ncbi:hypothetical protein OUZ56_026533 [Daphnia magna]|uniref:Uncharacterized protein n=1 Tax=Daphnia magna TaxID=35525 RepID=A0ABQ9ZM13_9CRUS|nr:hypothetical protein OUZ56_026533 [Daphnia magna]